MQEIARKDVVTARPDATVAEVAATMREEGVGSVVVVEDEAPVGILTDRDVAVGVVAGGLDPETTTAGDVMTADPFTVDVVDGIYDVLDRMGKEGVRRVPVVDAGYLEGIATLDDFVVVLTGEMDDLAKVIRAESPPY